MFKDWTKIIEKTGSIMGFIIAYSLFSAGLFTVLSLTRRLPLSWTFLHIASITLMITMIGRSLKKILQ